MATQTHWAAQYKDAPTQSQEYKTYLAACYIICRVGEEAAHETVCRAIGQIAHEQSCGTWHASSIYHNQLDTCMCAPCTNARKTESEAR